MSIGRYPAEETAHRVSQHNVSAEIYYTKHPSWQNRRIPFNVNGFRMAVYAKFLISLI
jgi:hypothetical protein